MNPTDCMFPICILPYVMEIPVLNDLVKKPFPPCFAPYTLPLYFIEGTQGKNPVGNTSPC